MVEDSVVKKVYCFIIYLVGLLVVILFLLIEILVVVIYLGFYVVYVFIEVGEWDGIEVFSFYMILV